MDDSMEAKEHIFESQYTPSVSVEFFLLGGILIVTGFLIFLLVYMIITLSDLECDYLNAQECCSRLNSWVVVKVVAHASITVILAILKYVYLTLCSLPLLIYLIIQYKKVPKGNFGVYDPAEICKHGELQRHMRDVMTSIGYYLIAFFIYLYCLLTNILKTPVAPLMTDTLQ